MLTEREYQELKKLRALGFNWLKSSKDRTVKAYTVNPMTGIALGIVGSHPMDVTDLRLDSVMYKNKIFNITTLMDEFISKLLSKQKKVEIPQFVADWIEEIKDKNCVHALEILFDTASMPAEVYDWLKQDSKNWDIMARAWLDGYEVEKEQLYTVRLKNGYHLCKHEGAGVRWLNMTEFNTADCYKLTQAEIESVDPRLMQFAEEVE